MVPGKAIPQISKCPDMAYREFVLCHNLSVSQMSELPDIYLKKKTVSPGGLFGNIVPKLTGSALLFGGLTRPI